jgi:hypothetical protein
MDERSSESHSAKKGLFAKGFRQGWLTVREIEAALPAEALTDTERWLLYYSLRAIQVEIVEGPPEHTSSEVAHEQG